MNAADEVRLASWATEIVETLLPGAKWRDEGDERRFLGRGGLLIKVAVGCWYDHSAKKGGPSPLGLIAHLKGCDRQQAITWAEAWLSAHAGFGAVGQIVGSDAAVDNATYANEVLDEATNIGGTPGETYFRSRGIDGEIPACIKFLHNAHW